MAFFPFSGHNMLESSKVCKQAGGPAPRHSCGVMERGRRTGDVDYGSMICGSNSSSGMAALPSTMHYSSVLQPNAAFTHKLPLTLCLLAQLESQQPWRHHQVAFCRHFAILHKWINCFIPVWSVIILLLCIHSFFQSSNFHCSIRKHEPLWSAVSFLFYFFYTWGRSTGCACPATSHLEMSLWTQCHYGPNNGAGWAVTEANCLHRCVCVLITVLSVGVMWV